MGFEPILTESQSVVLTVDTNVTIGPASRNRTHILEVEALCTIHCTIARKLAGPLGIEPRTTESKSVVIPFHYEPTKEKPPGDTM